MTVKPEFTGTIIIDEQERNHGHMYTFPGQKTKVKHLTTGDYSIEGCEHLVSVERKSHGDLCGSLGGGRDRLEREFQRGMGMQ